MVEASVMPSEPCRIAGAFDIRPIPLSPDDLAFIAAREVSPGQIERALRFTPTIRLDDCTGLGQSAIRSAVGILAAHQEYMDRILCPPTKSK